MNPQEAALPSEFDLNLMADTLNLHLGLALGVVKPAHIDQWLAKKTEAQKRRARVSYAWWLEYHEAN